MRRLTERHRHTLPDPHQNYKIRVLVTDKYLRRCAVTGEKAPPVLDAVHIRSVNEGGIHRIGDGLLLRSDVHVLFDRAYVTVTPIYRFRVSRRLKEHFDNSEHYYQFEKNAFWLPLPPKESPRPGVPWRHADAIFRRYETREENHGPA